LNYWHGNYTKRVARHLKSLDKSIGPAERLWEIIEVVSKQQLTKYDVVFRAWASIDPGIAAMVRKVDRSRLENVRSLFSQLGFRGLMLEMRARSFVAYVTFNPGVGTDQSDRQRLNCLRQFHAMITTR